MTQEQLKSVRSNKKSGRGGTLRRFNDVEIAEFLSVCSRHYLVYTLCLTLAELFSISLGTNFFIGALQGVSFVVLCVLGRRETSSKLRTVTPTASSHDEKDHLESELTTVRGFCLEALAGNELILYQSWYFRYMKIREQLVTEYGQPAVHAYVNLPTPEEVAAIISTRTSI